MGLPGALGVVPEGGDAPSIGLGDVAHLALEEHGRDSGSSAHTVLAPIPSEVPDLPSSFQPRAELSRALSSRMV